MRHVAFAVLIVLSSVAAAAPVPKQIGSDAEKLFGTLVEPKGCSVTFDKAEKAVTLTAVPSPDQPRKGTAGEHHALCSPRTGREVDGDFDVTVTVTLPNQADTAVTAGLYASYGEKDYVVLGHTLTSGKALKNQRGYVIKAVITDKLWNGTAGDWKAGGEEFTVRLTRKGKTITPYRLIDGKWEAIADMATTHDWPGKATVGVYVRAEKGEGTATFREFKLTVPEK